MYWEYIFVVLLLYVGTTAFQLFVSYLNFKNRHQSIPENVNDVYEASKYDKWLDYFMDNFKFQTIQSLINTLLILLLLVTGFFPWIFYWLEGMTYSIPLQILLFAFVYFLMSFITETAFSFYQQFHIEEKYGFNKTTLKTFVFDKVKSFILILVLGGGLMYGISQLLLGATYWFYIIVYLSLATVLVLANLLLVKLFVPIFNKLTPLEDGPLKTAIMNFATSVGYEVNKISVMDASRRSTKLNAYFSGFGKMKQIVLYDTLIQKMTIEEIIAVLAHEIGHNKHKHILIGMLQSLLLLGVYIVALYFILHTQNLYFAFGFDQIFIGFGYLLFLMMLSPLEIIVGFLFNAISRRHEYQADRFSATYYSKEAMISALKVIARSNFSNLNPHPMYVALNYSHPPIPSRIEAILALSLEKSDNSETNQNT